MNLNTIKEYVNLLLLLYSNKNSEINKLASLSNLGYQRIHKALKKWEETWFIEKLKKDILILGGNKYEFNLSSDGVGFLNNLGLKLLKNLGLREKIAEKFKLELKSSANGDATSIIEVLSEDILEILQDLVNTIVEEGTTKLNLQEYLIKIQKILKPQ
ncbi:MAG: hypothetical protein ACTSRZ_20020, partial [Promethearchaeota archaeon]